MNIPGSHPPAKFWRFLALGAVNWRSCFLTGFWLDAILLFGRKTSVVQDFSEIEKIKLCLCPDISTDSRWSTLIVKSKGSKGGNWPGIKDSSNSSRWIWFNFTKKTLLEKLFLTLDFLEFMNRQLSRQWVEITAMLAFAWKTTVEKLKWRFKQSFACANLFASTRTFWQPNQRFFQ